MGEKKIDLGDLVCGDVNNWLRNIGGGVLFLWGIYGWKVIKI